MDGYIEVEFITKQEFDIAEEKQFAEFLAQAKAAGYNTVMNFKTGREEIIPRNGKGEERPDVATFKRCASPGPAEIENELGVKVAVNPYKMRVEASKEVELKAFVKSQALKANDSN